MNMQQINDTIKCESSGLVEKIREYSRSQRELWQQVPYLALIADGRSGYSGKYGRAYWSGFWALDSSVQGGEYHVFVDLATGNLVDAWEASQSYSICDVDIPKQQEIKPARDKDILLLALALDELDAERIIEDLRKDAQYPYPSYYNPKEQEQWRETTKSKLKLSEIYNRT